MKLSGHANKLETNNTDIESQNFGIGDASVVIEILRNRLYKHKIRTLVQEYISNARDAMRESKSKKRIQVTFPNKFNATFKVRDFGPGITPDRMQKVFVLYGASTKRDSNGQTGGFGIGAKSAWSYTDSFTIVTYVDGVKRTYVAHTGVNNQGRLDLIDTTDTDEPNGTEIQIAIKPGDSKEFIKAISRTIYFWNDSERPELKGIADAADMAERIHGIKVGPAELLNASTVPEYIDWSEWNADDRPIAVIDGIVYDLNELMRKSKGLTKLRNATRNKLVLHIANGELEVSASRESIADSDLTIARLDNICNDAVKDINALIKSKFDAVKSLDQFVSAYMEMSESFTVPDNKGYKDFTIQYGSDLISDLFKSVNRTHIHCFKKRWGSIRRDTKGQKIYRDPQVDKNSIKLEQVGRVFVYDIQESKVKENKRIRSYLIDNDDLTLISPIAGKTKEFNKLVKALKAQNFSDIEVVELPKEMKPARPVRERGEFCIHYYPTGNYKENVHTSVDDNEDKWLYIPVKDGKFVGFEKKLDEVKDLMAWVSKHTDYKLGGLAEKSIKLVKGDSNFTLFSDWVKTFKAKKAHIAYAKHGLAKNDDAMQVLIRLKNVKIKDPFLKEMIDEYSDTTREEELPELLQHALKIQEVKDFEKKDKELTKVLNDQYPLIKMLDSWSMRRKDVTDIGFYVNQKYESLEG